VINNKRVLLESYPKPVVIFYHGNLYAKNSTFLTWNLKTNSFDYRNEKLNRENIINITHQKTRPYFFALNGSKSIFLNNNFKGLGYYSISNSYGLSFISFKSAFDFLNLFSFLNGKLGNLSNLKNFIGIGNYIKSSILSNIFATESENIFLIRNLIINSYLLHGISFTKNVNNSIIAQNVLLSNKSNGIILQNNSQNNYIYANISALNNVSGVSVYESDNNLIKLNKLLANKIDGVIIRNSLKTSVISNISKLNVKNGIELLNRKLKRKMPYHLATGSFVKNNRVIDNVFYNITVKNNAAIEIKNNFVKNKFYSNYGGDLNIFVPQIDRNHGNFKLYGIGNPFKSLLFKNFIFNRNVAKKIAEILIDASCYNDFISSILANLYYKNLKEKISASAELIRGISNLSTDSMYSYGLFLLGENKKIEGLSYLAESAIFGSKKSANDLIMSIYLFKIKKEDINKAFKMAIDRLKRYKLVEDEYNVSCPLTEEKKAKIESALKLFLYKYKLSKAKDYYFFLRKINKFTIFTKKNISKILNKYYTNNNFFALSVINQKHKNIFKVLKENEIIKENFKGCKLISIRLKRIKESVDSYYKTTKYKILTLLKPDIEQSLELINKIRINKIDYLNLEKKLKEN
jgi:poly(beta-D-mannuronate) C5 epimerase